MNQPCITPPPFMNDIRSTVERLEETGKLDEYIKDHLGYSPKNPDKK